MKYKTLITIRSVKEYITVSDILGDLYKPYNNQAFPDCIEMTDDVVVLLGLNGVKYSTLKVPVVNTQKE